MGYTPNALDQEDFIEDVQLLLEGEDLRVFNEIAMDPEIPRAAAVVAALRTLTAYHCPPGTRQIILDELRNTRKRMDMTLRQFSIKFRESLRMISLLQHGEDAPVSVPDVVRLYTDAMPVLWQEKFNDVPRVWTTLEEAEALFEHIERREQRTKTTRESRKRHDGSDSRPQKGSPRGQRNGKDARKTEGSAKHCGYCKDRGYKHDNHNNNDCFKNPESPKYRPL
jgi:hypothetical protein